jgi:amidase/nitrilase
VGGLICYENHMTLSKAALCTMGEEIHAAAWPGFWEQHGHPGDKTGAADEAAKDTCDIYPAVREYAFETQSFVASCSAYMDDRTPDQFDDEELGFGVGNGGSMLVNPAGIVKAGPVVGEEALLTADFHRDERRATKAYFDAMGHYARWDAVSLSISDETLSPLGPDDDRTRRLSAHRAEELATEYDIPIEAVEAVADALSE